VTDISGKEGHLLEIRVESSDMKILSSRCAPQAVDELLSVVQRLSLACDLESITRIVRSAARRLTGADGAAFVLRDGDCCHYADEDAIAPLWKGRRFPMSACISGWVMNHGEPAVIPDIYSDSRIPAEAYRPTFVKSLVMVPIRRERTIGAIGAYWAGRREFPAETVGLLQALADSTCAAMESVRRLQNLAALVQGSIAIAAERSLPGALQRAAETARTITGAFLTVGHLLRLATVHSSVADPYDESPPASSRQAGRGAPASFRSHGAGDEAEGLARTVLARMGCAESLRIDDETLPLSPAWWEGRPDHAPPRGLLAVRLSDSHGAAGGLLLAGGKADGGEFSAQDEALLAQLAAITSLTLQHLSAHEDAKRLAAERTAVAEERARKLQALALELPVAEEGERRRIGELLHEDLEQLQASLDYQHQVLQQSAGEGGSTLRQVGKLLEDSIGKCRRLSQDASPPALHLGGPAMALEWLAREMRARYGLAVDLDAEECDLPGGEPLGIFLFRAAQELLFNVVKHAGVASARVRLRGLSDRIEIVVSDPGRGFDPSRIESGGGMAGGLGLFGITERVGLLGGNLRMDSSPGRGSCFTLTVPWPGRAFPPRSGGAGPAAADAAAAGSRLRVLLADDHQVIRQGLVSLLESQPDLQVVGEASDGQEAVELACRLRPDVVLMDVSMPRMDGLQATRRIKERLPGIRVIGLSMFDEETVGGRLREAGAEAYVSKAGPSQDLLEAIRREAASPGRAQTAGMEPIPRITFIRDAAGSDLQV
jgi:signal transduction histidine kinase/ActR/RegA family two-component response regulator